MNEKLIKDQIEQLIDDKKLHELRQMLSEQNEADIAACLSDLNIEKLSIAFRILPKELAADAFSYFDSDILIQSAYHAVPTEIGIVDYFAVFKHLAKIVFKEIHIFPSLLH